MSEAKYIEIARKIESLIDIGHYQKGSQLPTHRALADEFGTTPMTIAKAYKVLAEGDRVESFVGRGSFVKDRSQLKQVIQSQFDENEWNFSILQPCFSEHLVALHGQLQQSFQDHINPRLYGYTEDTGLIHHREAGMLWAQRFGLQVRSPEQILLTNGAQHALSTLIELYSKPGDRIAVEAQTYPGILSIANFLGRQPVAVAMDEQGMMPEALAEVCQQHQPVMVIVVPSHQNPTAVTMPQARREALAEIIQQYPLWLVEDDIYGFLNDATISAISNSLPEKSFYINSLSKAISPGMRCGYIKAPQSQVAKLAAYIRATVWLPSPFMFEVAADLIQSGMAFDMAKQQTEIARQRQIIARQILAAHPLRSQPTSYHIWLTLPGNWQADQFALTAKERGMLVSSGSYFNVGTTASQSIRLSLMAISDEAVLRLGLQALATLLEQNDSAFMQG